MGSLVPINRTPLGVSDVIELARRVSKKQAPAEALLPVLQENAKCYQGLGSDECERLRGVCFSALEGADWKDCFESAVLEELRTSYHPASLAGAARAIRGCQKPPPESAEILADAFERIVRLDRRIDPTEFELAASYEHANTITIELAESICSVPTSNDISLAVCKRVQNQSRWLKPEIAEQVLSRLDQIENRKVCRSCSNHGDEPVKNSEIPFDMPTRFWAKEVEDQSGKVTSLCDVLLGKPSFLTFFYTRCMNPTKCSATITRLAALQRQLGKLGLLGSLNLAAMTYDAGFDSAKRLRTYGKDRGIEFGKSVQLIRMPARSEDFFSSLQLLVGYGPSTVNRHGLNAFIFNKEGKAVHSFTRRAFECDDVIEKLRALY